MRLANTAFARTAFCMASIAILVCMVVSLVDAPRAQDASNRPARASEAADALLQESWRQLDDGLFVKHAATALGTRLTVLRVSAANFRVSVEQQNKTSGERAQSVMRRTGASVVINGGFFGQRADGTLYPVGQLTDEGAVLSSPWIDQGGFLSIDSEGRASINPSRNPLPESVVEVVQSRPVLIEPGEIWAMRTNGTEPEWRTLFCVLKSGDYLVMVISGGGLTLFEAGWLFRSAQWGGVFGCDSAIALDGGGSTQMSVRGNKDLNITGLTPVQNLIAISPRQQ